MSVLQTRADVTLQCTTMRLQGKRTLLVITSHWVSGGEIGKKGELLFSP